MNKKKILFVLDQYNIGGPQKSLLGLLENIDYSKFEISVTAIKDQGILKDYIPDQVNIIKCPIDVSACLMPSNNTSDYVKWLALNGRITILLSFVLNVCKYKLFHFNMNKLRQRMWLKYHERLSKISEEFDAVFAYGAGLTTYVAVDSVNAKKRYYRIANDYRIIQLDKTIEEGYFRKMDGFIAVSKQCGEIFKEEYPFVKNVTTFYNFIPVEFYKRLKNPGFDFTPTSSELSIFTTCRIDKLKGFEYLIDAAKYLSKENINYVWYVIGDGPSRSEYEALCLSEGLSCIRFLGFLINPFEVFSKCQIMVHPSITEGKSNAVDEAKYYGIPVVATRYPTVTDQIIDGETGLICEFDGKDIADKIITLINDKSLYLKIKTNTYHKADADPAVANEFLSKICQLK